MDVFDYSWLQIIDKATFSRGIQKMTGYLQQVRSSLAHSQPMTIEAKVVEWSLLAEKQCKSTLEVLELQTDL